MIVYVVEGDVEDVNCVVCVVWKVFDYGLWFKMFVYKWSEIFYKYVLFFLLFFLDVLLIYSKFNVECWVYICIYRL